jgi:hypothetical protein
MKCAGVAAGVLRTLSGAGCCPCRCCRRLPRRVAAAAAVGVVLGTAVLLLALEVSRWQEEAEQEAGGASVAIAAMDGTSSMGLFAMRITAGLPLRALSRELRALRDAGAASALGMSWARAGPALHATMEVCWMWGEALYPSALFVVSLWIELLQHVGPPLIVAVKGANPLVAWALAGTFISGIVSLLVGRECRRRRVFQRVDAWYRRHTRRWSRRWLSFHNSVREKSALAARLLPHVLLASMFTVSVGLFSPKWAADILSDGQTIALIALPVPMVLSMRAILSTSENIKTKTMAAAALTTEPPASQSPKETAVAAPPVSDSKSREWLSYWTMVAFASFVWRFPVLGPTLVQGVRAFRLGILFFVLWLQCPLTDGAGLGLCQLQHLIGKYVRVRHARMTTLEDSSFALRAMVAMGIITDEQRVLFSQVLTDGGNVILLSAVFLVTPGFVTEIGCLLVGVAYPIYASVASVAAGPVVVQGAAGTSAKVDPAGASAGAGAGNIGRNSHTWWLMYWIVFIVFSLCHDFASAGLSWLPLWYHARLVGTVWLQLPYFRGAKVLFVAGVKRIVRFHSAVTTTPPGPVPPGRPFDQKHATDAATDQNQNQNEEHVVGNEISADVGTGGVRRRSCRGPGRGAAEEGAGSGDEVSGEEEGQQESPKKGKPKMS